MAVDSTSLYNPYALNYGLNAQSGLSDDFMWNAYLANSQKQSGTQTPTFQGSNLSGQPSTDCYQSSGSSALTDGLKLGVVGGLGTAAGMYYFGGEKAGMNIYQDGKYQDAFLKTLEDENVVAKGVKRVKDAKIKKLFGEELTAEQYKALEKFAKGESWPKGIERPSIISDPAFDEIARPNIKTKIEKISKINGEKLAKHIAKTETLEGSVSRLNTLNARHARLTALPTDITTEKLAEHLEANAKFYGIEGADEAATKARAQKLAGAGRDKLIKGNERLISRQKSVVENVRQALSDKMVGNYDPVKNKLIEGANENIAKSVKNFKFTKAGKYGLIAAGVGLVLGWMFGGKS